MEEASQIQTNMEVNKKLVEIIAEYSRQLEDIKKEMEQTQID